MYTAIECFACGVDIPQDEEMLKAYMTSRQAPIVFCNDCKNQSLEEPDIDDSSQECDICGATMLPNSGCPNESGDEHREYLQSLNQ